MTNINFSPKKQDPPRRPIAEMIARGWYERYWREARERIENEHRQTIISPFKPWSKLDDKSRAMWRRSGDWLLDMIDEAGFKVVPK